MFPDKNEYSKMVKAASKPSKKAKDYICAFVIGGFICVIGQLLFELYSKLGLSEMLVRAAVPSTLIVIASLLTGIGVFDKIAKHAGAGTLVPITGFANSVVSPALEAKTEGMVLGTGAKIFTIAGPVILYGILASWLAGIVYWIISLF